MHTGFRWGRLGKDHLVNPGIDVTITLIRIFRKSDVRAWAGLICLRIETGGGHL